MFYKFLQFLCRICLFYPPPPPNITFCRLLVISYLSYYELSIYVGKILHRCVLYMNKTIIFQFLAIIAPIYQFNPQKITISYNSQALPDSGIEDTTLP